MSVLGGSLFDTVIRSIINDYGGSNNYPTGPAGLFSGILGGIIIGGIILLYGGFIAITSYAVGEGIYLAIGIEENTRATASLLQQQNS